MSFLNFFRRKKIEDEAARRARLLSTGRITEGNIIDITSDDAGQISAIFFSYTIHGVSYRATQTLTDEQRSHLKAHVPAANITVRYDPRRPGNSVVI